MDRQQGEKEKRGALPQAKPAKKPYEKPAVVFRAPLETMASVCTRTFANSTSCPGTGKGDASCSSLHS